MHEELSSELAALGRALGAHPARLATHGEGSCAAKLSEEQILVSARGAHMARLAEADLIEVETAKMHELLGSETAAEDAAPEGENIRRASEDASIYTYLFTFEGVRFGAHTQPIVVNQILCSPRARQFSDRRTYHDEIAACGISSVLVPYIDPGLPLGRELKRKVILWRDRHKLVPKLVLIQNHGMIVLGKSPEEVMKSIEMTIKAAEIFVGASLLGGPVFLTPNNVAQIDSLKD